MGEDQKCFSWLPGGSLDAKGDFDFTVYELYLPTRDQAGVIDLGQIAYDVVIPAKTETEKVQLKLSCGSASTYFKNGTYGQPKDTPTFIDATPVTASHANSYSMTPTLKIDDYVATIEYEGDYIATTAGAARNYWAVIPVKTTSGSVKATTALKCKALFQVTDSTGFTYNMLQIEEAKNGPILRSSSDSKYRDNFYNGQRVTNADDKYYLNWHSDWSDRTWRNGLGYDFQVQLKMQWGMAPNSWCLGAVPKHLNGFSVENVLTENAAGATVGNLTVLRNWRWGVQDVMLMKNNQDGDIWPDWPNKWNINGLSAPYGEQRNWNLDDKYAFNAYLVCGNQKWWEGEGGWTYDSLLIDECDDSYVTVDLSPAKVDELDMLFTYTAEVELDKDYGICAKCKIEMEWNTIFKPAYMKMTSGSNGLLGDCTTNVDTGVASCTTK